MQGPVLSEKLTFKLRNEILSPLNSCVNFKLRSKKVNFPKRCFKFLLLLSPYKNIFISLSYTKSLLKWLLVKIVLPCSV